MTVFQASMPLLKDPEQMMDPQRTGLFTVRFVLVVIYVVVELYVAINILVLALAAPTFFMMFLLVVFLVLVVLYVVTVFLLMVFLVLVELYVITELFMVTFVFVLVILTELCYVMAALLFLVLETDVKRLQLFVEKPSKFCEVSMRSKSFFEKALQTSWKPELWTFIQAPAELSRACNVVAAPGS